MAKLVIVLCIISVVSANNSTAPTALSIITRKWLNNLLEALATEVEMMNIWADEREASLRNIAKLHPRNTEPITAELTKKWVELESIMAYISNIDVSECTQLAEKLNKTAILSMTQIDQCGQKYLERSTHNVKVIKETRAQRRKELADYAEAGNKCGMGNVSSTEPHESATECMKRIAFKAILEPESKLALFAEKLNYVLLTIKSRLDLCMAKLANAYTSQSTSILNEVRLCIDRKKFESEQSLKIET